MSQEDYRSRRRALMEKIDLQFNGALPEQDGELTSPSLNKAEFGIISNPADPMGKAH
ncbi:MAG: hypothetical protein K6L76_04870 [Agarilytica sp.]